MTWLYLDNFDIERLYTIAEFNKINYLYINLGYSDKISKFQYNLQSLKMLREVNICAKFDLSEIIAKMTSLVKVIIRGKYRYSFINLEVMCD